MRLISPILDNKFSQTFLPFLSGEESHFFLNFKASFNLKLLQTEFEVTFACPGLEVIKLLSCSIQLRMDFHLVIKINIPTVKTF